MKLGCEGGRQKARLVSAVCKLRTLPAFFGKCPMKSTLHMYDTTTGTPDMDWKGSTRHAENASRCHSPVGSALDVVLLT